MRNDAKSASFFYDHCSKRITFSDKLSEKSISIISQNTYVNNLKSKV